MAQFNQTTGHPRLILGSFHLKTVVTLVNCFIHGPLKHSDKTTKTLPCRTTDVPDSVAPQRNTWLSPQ